MLAEKTEILRKLQKDILALQGYKTIPAGRGINIDLGPIATAFPNQCFPLAAIHEFLSVSPESAAATTGFISCLVGSLMQEGAPAVWISPGKTIFPAALSAFGIQPDKIIFIDSRKETEALWIMEEALKCEGIAGVICEIPDINFTASRRLQLVVEKSEVTGFILRKQPKYQGVNACIASWKIDPIPTRTEDELPGIGYPRWNIELSKVRNGKPGSWQMEWAEGMLHLVAPAHDSLHAHQIRKAG